MAEQKPSLGCIVLVVLPDSLASVNNGTDTAPAIITRVWNDRMINVKVQMDAVQDEWLTSVEYDEKATEPRSWHWPPRV